MADSCIWRQGVHLEQKFNRIHRGISNTVLSKNFVNVPYMGDGSNKEVLKSVGQKELCLVESGLANWMK